MLTLFYEIPSNLNNIHFNFYVSHFHKKANEEVDSHLFFHAE